MEDIDRLYKLVAGGDHETVIALLTAVQDTAADIRIPFKTANSEDIEVNSVEDVRLGAVAILTTMIDKLRFARKTLEQRPGPLNTEGE